MLQMIRRRWMALTVGISLLQLPFAALADETRNPTISEPVDLSRGLTVEHSGGGVQGSVTGQYQATTTETESGSTTETNGGGGTRFGLHLYGLRVEPGSGGVIRAQGLNLTGDLAGSGQGFHAGVTGDANVGYGWRLGSGACGWGTMLTGRLEGQYHTNADQNSQITASPGLESGLVCTIDDATTLTLAPFIEGRLGYAPDGNPVALETGGRLRLGISDIAFLTAQGSHTPVGLGEGSTTDARASLDIRVADRWLVTAQAGATWTDVPDAGGSTSRMGLNGAVGATFEF